MFDCRTTVELFWALRWSEIESDRLVSGVLLSLAPTTTTNVRIVALPGMFIVSSAPQG